MVQNKITAMSKKLSEEDILRYSSATKEWLIGKIKSLENELKEWPKVNKVLIDRIENQENENSQLQLDVKSNENVIKGYQDRNDNLFKELTNLKELSCKTCEGSGWVITNKGQTSQGCPSCGGAGNLQQRYKDEKEALEKKVEELKRISNHQGLRPHDRWEYMHAELNQTKDDK